MNTESLQPSESPVQSPASDPISDEERALSFELATLLVKKSIRRSSIEAIERGCFPTCDPDELAEEYTSDLQDLIAFEERAEEVIRELERIREQRAARRVRPRPPVRPVAPVRRSSVPRPRSRRIQAPRPSPSSSGPDEPPGPPGSAPVALPSISTLPLSTRGEPC